MNQSIATQKNPPPRHPRRTPARPSSRAPPPHPLAAPHSPHPTRSYPVAALRVCAPRSCPVAARTPRAAWR